MKEKVIKIECFNLKKYFSKNSILFFTDIRLSFYRQLCSFRLKFRNNFEESFEGAEFKMDTDSLTNELLEVRNKNRNRNKETVIIIKTLCRIGKKSCHKNC